MSAVEDIMENVDVLDWLEHESIEYRKVGGSHNVNLRECPFCASTSWKVYFHTEKKRGLCFAGDCGTKFNLFSFARQHLQTNNAGTFQHFERYGTTWRPRDRSPREDVVTEGWKLPENIPLPTPDDATHPFLVDRKITLPTQRLFDLRWCDKGRWRYQDIDGVRRQMIYDQRIIIPIYDLDGEVKSFLGRDVTGTSDKRYLFPATLPGTGRFLYGGHLSMGKPHLVIGEGPFDVMAIHQAIEGQIDFRGVGTIGSFGLSIGMSDDGDDQLSRLLILKRQGLETLTFLWDGEYGAFMRALDYGETLKKKGFRVKVGLLPADLDPNEVETRVVREAIQAAFELTPDSLVRGRLSPPYKTKR